MVIPYMCNESNVITKSMMCKYWTYKAFMLKYQNLNCSTLRLENAHIDSETTQTLFGFQIRIITKIAAT